MTTTAFQHDICNFWFNFQLLSYLKDGDLAPGDSEGHGHTLAVGTESVALTWSREVEASQVSDVCVSVHHRTLDVTELGGWP